MKVFPRATGWRRILITTTTAGAAVTSAAAALGALVGSGAAAASAAFGGAAVLLLTGISLFVVDRTERRAPHLSMMMFMLTFALKISLLTLLLMLVPAPGWIEPIWAVLTAAGVVVTVQAVQIATFSRLRLSVTPEDQQ